MMLLKVKNLKKIYATRFGGQKIEALKNMLQSWVNQGVGRRPC